MKSHQRLAGERVYLRTYEPGDVETLVRWMNDPDVVQYLLADRALYNSLREQDWINRLYTTDTDYVFGICVKTDDALIGSVGLHRVDRVDSFATIGIMIGEKEHWSKGYGAEAIRLAVDYAFRTQNLNRVELETLAHNERAIKCYKKVGFVEEGRMRKRRFKNGAYCDELVMAVLRKDWPGMKSI
jgi:RimJ/RimL family protein N-acetyltransferase